MGEDIKIYHVETQEDYDDMMIELENQGYKWISGDKPTNKPEYWGDRKENTTVLLNGFQNYRMTRGALDYHKRKYPFTTVIKHKAKGVKQVEKVVVPQFVADWYERTMTPNFRIGDTLKKLEDVTSEEIHLWEEAIGNDYEFWYETAEKTIVRMWLHDYEIKEDIKYYWRKKKEYLCIFEEREELYLNVNKETGKLSFESKIEIGIMQTILTETEVRRMVSKEDFIKLEKVEITE